MKKNYKIYRDFFGIVAIIYAVAWVIVSLVLFGLWNYSRGPVMPIVPASFNTVYFCIHNLHIPIILLFVIIAHLRCHIKFIESKLNEIQIIDKEELESFKKDLKSKY